jgi:hypothetical protein
MLHFFRQSLTNCLDYDGSLDNGIVGHEYGHGISIRLTGTGPSIIRKLFVECRTSW